MSNSEVLKVIKRDGSTEYADYNKVYRRIENKSKDLPAIDIELLAKKIYRQIYDGVKTSQLDELTGELCASLMTDVPEYGILGSRIIISNNHKNTSPSFSEVIYILWSNKDIIGKNAPMINNKIKLEISFGEGLFTFVIEGNPCLKTFFLLV